jgi:hypothetical protein
MIDNRRLPRPSLHIVWKTLTSKSKSCAVSIENSGHKIKYGPTPISYSVWSRPTWQITNALMCTLLFKCTAYYVLLWMESTSHDSWNKSLDEWMRMRESKRTNLLQGHFFSRLPPVIVEITGYTYFMSNNDICKAILITTMSKQGPTCSIFWKNSFNKSTMFTQHHWIRFKTYYNNCPTIKSLISC